LSSAKSCKRVLLAPPHPHVPTPSCDFHMQKGLGRAWALASDLAWEVRPAISTTTLEAALCPLADHLSCEPCKAALNARIKALVSEWAIVKVRVCVRPMLRLLTVFSF
ncbi:hypothetical protein B0H10DRAFT_1795126, partial [Mycena sp. CBHHK59/15]